MIEKEVSFCDFYSWQHTLPFIHTCTEAASSFRLCMEIDFEENQFQTYVVRYTLGKTVASMSNKVRKSNKPAVIDDLLLKNSLKWALLIRLGGLRMPEKLVEAKDLEISFWCKEARNTAAKC